MKMEGKYTKKIQIEGRVLGDISNKPCNSYCNSLSNTLIENVKGLKDILELILKASLRTDYTIKSISKHIEGINSKV
jgi:glutamine synthetase